MSDTPRCTPSTQHCDRHVHLHLSWVPGAWEQLATALMRRLSTHRNRDAGRVSDVSVRFFSSSCCECALPAMGQLFVFDGESVFLVKPHVSFSMYSDFTYLQEWSSREFYQPSLRNTEGFWWPPANPHKKLAGTVCHHLGIPWSVGKEMETVF